jgi:hypothetical protein
MSLVGAAQAANPYGDANTLPPKVPLGFLVQPAGVAPTATSMSFRPDGKKLYVATNAGFVIAFDVLLGGKALGLPSFYLSNLSSPLGVLATSNAVFVSVVQGGKGAVLRTRDLNGDGISDRSEVVIAGLPIGRHNTNALAIGPDGMLYIANGSSSDSGFRDEGGPPEQPPYSGSLLRVSPTATNLTPQPAMVVATGWRNPFGLAFVPLHHPRLQAGLAAVTMNGPDGDAYPQAGGGTITRPTGEDTLNLVNVSDGVVEHFGFPWCLYDRAKGGLNGFTQDSAEGACEPLPVKAGDGLLAPLVRARPVALFGTHVSANGLAFNPGGNFPAQYNGDLFVTEFGSNGVIPLIGHKIVRVHFGPGGAVESVQDFMSSALPLAIAFGPDGALWVGDFSGVLLRVSSIPTLSLTVRIGL